MLQQSNFDEVDAIRRKADGLLASGEAEHALACYDQLIAVDPDSLRALEEKARVLLTLDRYEEAIECYQRGLSIDPKNLAILVSKAFALRRVGRDSEALECLDQALVMRPDDPQTLGSKGDLLLDLERYEEAIHCFERAVAARPDAFGASDWTGWGDRLSQSGNVDQAISFYDRATALDRSYVWAWRGKAFALNVDPEKKKEALGCLEQALQIDPNPLLWVDKGNFYLSDKRFEEAKASYQKASELDPKHFPAWFNTGIALEQQGQFEEALHFIDRAIEVDPTITDAWVEKGYCLANLTRWEESIKCYDRALELSATTFWAWNNKGWDLMQLGRKEEAIKLFDEAIKIDATDSTPWVNKSRCLLESERLEEAKQCLESAQRTVTDQRWIFFSLALLYSEHMYDHEKAIGLYQQSLSHGKQWDIDDIGVRANIAECLIKLGKYEEGRNLLTEIKDQFTDSCRRSALSYLTMTSYALEGDTQNRGREFGEFLNRFREWEVDKRSGKTWTWNFRGLVNSIVNSKVDPETEFLLLASADLQQGTTNYLSTWLLDKLSERPPEQSKSSPS